MKRGLIILRLTAVAAAFGCGTGWAPEPADPLTSPRGRPSTFQTTAVAPQPSLTTALEEPTGDRPVVAAATLQPTPARPGRTIVLVVQVRTAPGWHIYAAGADSGPAVPTSLTLKLPAGWSAAEEWVLPEAVPNQDGQGGIYEGSFAFRRSLTVPRQAAPGPVDVICELRFRACDPFSCRPPATLTVSARTEVVVSP
jgi:DsbC/DsbD-like thiol-disulfide interchange protein